MIPDLTGQQLDTYRLVRRLGQGTFGNVYEATDLHNGKQVAVKVMEPLKTQQAIQQFFNEVRALVRLRHALIVPVLDFGVVNATGIPFIVMEYAPDGSLRQRHPRGTQVPLATVVQYVKSLAEALQCAHDDKLIHRDVKPDNVLLGSNGKLLLGDFGIATLSSSLRIDLNQPIPPGIAGTAFYMAPEQCQGKPEKASDQYALAVMTYEWLCGQPPFTQGNVYNIYYQHIHEPVPPLHDRLLNLPPKVEAIIMRALAKKPEERFPNISAFSDELANAYRNSLSHLTMNKHHQDFIQRAIELEKQFLANNGQGLESNPAYLESHGQSGVYPKYPVIVTAPHAVVHWRNGTEWDNQVNTGALALQLAKKLGGTALIFAKSIKEDAPNYYSVSPFKGKLLEIRSAKRDEREGYAPAAAFDLHGIPAGWNWDVLIGTGHGKTLCDKSEFLDILITQLQRKGITQLGIDRTEWAADTPVTIAQTVARTNLPCFQLAISRKFRDPRQQPEHYIQLFTALFQAYQLMQHIITPPEPGPPQLNEWGGEIYEVRVRCPICDEYNPLDATVCPTCGTPFAYE